MNDFLKNLRSSQNKESSDPKRNLDGHFYPKTDRRKISDRRSGKSPAAPNLTALVEELIQFLPGLKDNSNLFSSLCEQVDVNAESLIEASIRRNNAVADFF